MNLADYDPNQQQKKPPQPGQPGGDLFNAQAPSSAPPPMQGPQQTAQTLAGSTPGAGDVKPGPTLTPPGGYDLAKPGPTLTPPGAPAPAGGSGAKRETVGGMNGVRLANGDWVPADNPAAIAAMGGESQAVYPGGAAAGAPAAPGATPAVPGAPGATPPPQGPPQTVADAFKKTLMDKLNQGPVSLNDPNLKAQSDAFAVGQARAAERGREQAAERLASQGLGSSGAADSAYTGIQERAGENMANYNAGLVGDAAKQQADEIRQYVAIAGNQLNAEEARALQERLGTLDAQIRREGIQQQGALGQGDLALRGRIGEGQLNLGLIGTLGDLDYRNRALNQQGAQFSQGLDTQTILGLLGGL